MAKLISDPQIRINNESFQIVPNSAKYVPGDGEDMVKAQSSGGGNVSSVYSRNVETKVGKVMVAMFATSENIDKIKTLKDNENLNYISITDGAFSKTMRNAALISDPEIQLSNEGQIELEFQGLPVE